MAGNYGPEVKAAMSNPGKRPSQVKKGTETPADRLRDERRGIKEGSPQDLKLDAQPANAPPAQMSPPPQLPPGAGPAGAVSPHVQAAAASHMQFLVRRYVMAVAPTVQNSTQTDDDAASPTASPTTKVLAYLRTKGIPPSSANVRAALEANARDPGVIPGLRSDTAATEADDQAAMKAAGPGVGRRGNVSTQIESIESPQGGTPDKAPDRSLLLDNQCIA